MRTIFLIIASTFFIHTGIAQNLVGMSSDGILTHLKDKGINSDSINLGKNNDGTAYISYEKKERKHIYFLDSTMNCYCYRVVYKYHEMNSVIKKLNEQFVPQGHFRWVDYGRENYIITLEKKDDFFVTDMVFE